MTVDGEALRDGLRRDPEVVAVDRDDPAARLLHVQASGFRFRGLGGYCV